jgi:hypothetical protein
MTKVHSLLQTAYIKYTYNHITALQCFPYKTNESYYLSKRNPSIWSIVLWKHRIPSETESSNEHSSTK